VIDWLVAMDYLAGDTPRAAPDRAARAVPAAPAHRGAAAQFRANHPHTKRQLMAATDRLPVHVHVGTTDDVRLDTRSRMVTFQGTNPILLDRYLVRIPVATLKQIVGKIIVAEGMHEITPPPGGQKT
jgi:hypothetical protein